MIAKEKVPNFEIRPANVQDTALILSFIRELAEYEQLANEVIATEESLRATLFSEKPAAEVIIGEIDSKPVAFALFFHNYSTFMGKPGLYLEDLFVKPEFRSIGLGRAMLSYLAKLAISRGCGRFEWWVLDWNTSAIRFYEMLGATAMSDWTVQRVTGEALHKLANSYD